MNNLLNEDYLEFQRLYSNATLYASIGNYDTAKNCLGFAKQSLIKFATTLNGEQRLIIEDFIEDIEDSIKLVRKADKNSLKQSGNGNLRAESNDLGSMLCKTSFESATIPTTTFDDIAGLDDVKREVNFKTIYPKKYPDIYKAFNKKCGGGILLYGLPGTGKTMIAEAIAHETGAKFYPIRCSDLGSKWFGETEKNLGRLFDEAREQDNAVIFFDEIEAYTNKRRDNAMNRVIPELLSQMQGVGSSEYRNKILIVAATNRPWDIDSAFLRPGRFDERIFVPLPDAPSRKTIIENRLKNVEFDNSLDITELVLKTEGFNGADVDYLCEKAKENAIGEIISGVRSSVVITKADFNYALSHVKSSVVLEDVERIKNWQ